MNRSAVGVAVVVGAAVAAVTSGVQQSALPELRNFSPKEFGIWWALMNPDLLTRLDDFRDRLGFPVSISTAPGAIGRHTGNPSSQHHVTRGKIAAVDVMPHWPLGGTKGELRQAYNLAVELGFTGVGLYPDWSPRPGLHLDVRDDRQAGNPATWSGIKVAGVQKYGAIEAAFV